MVFHRRRHRRFGRRARRPGGRSRNWAGLAMKAYKGFRFIRGLVNVEKKYFDITPISGAITNTGSVTNLTATAQGDDVANRNGNSILGKTMYIRFHWYRDVVNTAATNTVRMIVVKDMENTGSAITVTDLLATNTVDAPLNVDHTARYQIMKDKVYTLSLNGSEGVASHWFIRVNDHVKYTGSANTDIYKNQIYLVLLTSETANAPVCNLTSRFGFYDN